MHVFVDLHGGWSGVRSRPTNSVSIGLWWPSQFSYRPFIDAVNAGVDEARAAQSRPRSQRRGQFSAAQFKLMPIGDTRGKPINSATIEAMRLVLVDGLPIGEAARKVGWHRRNVQRALGSMRRRLEAS